MRSNTIRSRMRRRNNPVLESETTRAPYGLVLPSRLRGSGQDVELKEGLARIPGWPHKLSGEPSLPAAIWRAIWRDF